LGLPFRHIGGGRDEKFLRLFEIARVLVRFDARRPFHRKLEITARCDRLRDFAYPTALLIALAQRATGDRMAAASKTTR
jgi:hypothetical protein